MSNAIQLQVPSFRSVVEAVELLAMTPARKRRYLSRVARMVIAQSKKNVQEQKTLDGTPMAPRKNSSKTGKMLKGLVKGKWLGVKMPDENTTQLFFFRNAGIVARKHQLGGREAGIERESLRYKRDIDSGKISKRLMNTRFTVRGMTGCSANHAAMLLRLEYLPPQVFAGLPGYGVAGIEHVMQNVTRKQALFLIGKAKERTGTTKVPDNTPARPFLGAAAEQMEKFKEVIYDDLDKNFRAKNFSSLLR